MSHDPQDVSPVFRIDVGQNASKAPVHPAEHQQDTGSELTQLLQQMVIGQERQNELLEELVDQMHSSQKQRSIELNQWKDSNPILARRCRAAAEALSQVQTEFLHKLTVDVNDNFENMIDGDFVMNEFVDRYGPRLAHLNGVLQMLSQLSANPSN
jgi:hypothetical protein